MLFNSLEFMIFFPSVFLLYWLFFHDRIKIRNTFLLVVSYVFYGWWDWRFLILIVFSSFVDFNIGKLIYVSQSDSRRKMLLAVSLIANLGLLFYFKYTNFFLESFCNAFSFLGRPIEYSRIKIILPVGISFYTFQTLSYTIDIYKNKIKPSDSVIDFFAFVSFFPQLVAGPIERASRLLPQFKEKIFFDQSKVVSGFRLILWGLIKKVVIADRLATYIDPVYGNIENHNSVSLLIASIFFAIQIYCDFSGYSDIAIGTAKSMGFDLMENFRTPYFSTNVTEYWKRNHISLTTWFRDYIYFPLVETKPVLWRILVITMLTFTLSGLWHGANWTFVIWGVVQGIYLCFDILVKRRRKALTKLMKKFHMGLILSFLRWLVTFAMLCFGLIFFRARSVHDAFLIMHKLADFHFAVPFWARSRLWVYFLLGILVLMVVDSIIRFKGLDLFLKEQYMFTRWSIYFFGVFLIVLTGVLNDSQFIYFQF